MTTDSQKGLSFETLPTRIKDKCGRVIEVRAYEAADYEGLKAMYDTFEPKGLEAGLPPEDDQARVRWLQHVTSSLFNLLALHKGRVIGHCAIDLGRAPSCPEYLIFIQESFRDHGIGTRLSEVMKEVTKEAGCEKVWLTVRTANTCAINVFKKVGFEFCGGIEIERDMELNLKRAKVSSSLS